MPELPDIALYLHALGPRTVGQTLQRVRLASPFLVRTVDPPLTSLHGEFVRGLRRIGKRIVFEFDGPRFLVLHLMIAGRLRWKPAGAELSGRMSLAAFDFPGGTLLLTEAGSKKRASLHVVAGEAALSDHDLGGLEVLGATRGEFVSQLQSERRTLKRALTESQSLQRHWQRLLRRILHAARLSPLQLTPNLSDEELDRLHRAVKDVLTLWVERLRQECGDGFPDKVTAFRDDMAVHGRFGKPCPRCSSPVQHIVYANNECNYCPACQTGGRLLADRSLSRLLGKDWPRTLEELEELRRR